MDTKKEEVELEEKKEGLGGHREIETIYDE